MNRVTYTATYIIALFTIGISVIGMLLCILAITGTVS